MLLLVSLHVLTFEKDITAAESVRLSKAPRDCSSSKARQKGGGHPERGAQQRQDQCKHLLDSILNHCTKIVSAADQTLQQHKMLALGAATTGS